MTDAIYFTQATFRFLSQLARHNNRTWFKSNQSRYERDVREPFLDLITDLQPHLAEISPHFRADPRKLGGSLFRIQRDTRFSSNKTPYKTWAGARLYHARHRERPAPSFYVHLEPGGCFVGAGLWHPEPSTLKQIRAFIADNPAAWNQAVHRKPFAATYAFWGDRLKRAPQGYLPDHPLIEDLKLKSYAAGCGLPDSSVLEPGLARDVGIHLRRLAPLVDYLCAALDLEF